MAPLRRWKEEEGRRKEIKRRGEEKKGALHVGFSRS